MRISDQLVESLLFEEESAMLDFKSQQYAFDGADREVKSELLKDILAFANAWRRSDAFILTGVEEMPGGRSRVAGVSHHLDDAKLQQLVNSNTQRPMHFSYVPVRLDGRDIGVIHIPVQQRPIYLVKDYGKLKRHTVYIRRGSSTDTASPDEVARMGRTETEDGFEFPLLDAQFFDVDELTSLGTAIKLRTTNLSVPGANALPDYPIARRSTAPFGIDLSYSVSVNRDYYRDVATYLQAIAGTGCLNFGVTNSGSVTAHDVKMEIVLNDPERTLIVRDSNAMPDEPSTSFLPRISIGDDIAVQRSRSGWVIAATLGKIQAKGHAHTSSGLFLGALEETKLVLKARMFADNLPAPRESKVKVHIVPARNEISVEDLIKKYSK